MFLPNNIEPKKVISYFGEICSMPHGSSNTTHISNYLVDFAKKRNLRVIQDKLGNVVIFKDGTTGYEKSKPVIIQGHMDMVCEKTQDSNIDFTKDGLDLRIDGNVIYAHNTTLGGDDGIAVAYALALLDSSNDEIEHPPLEVVITVDEEIGMLGAAGLDCSVLRGNIMLNLDSEEEGKLLVSCAGGASAVCELDVKYTGVGANKTGLLIKLEGATGGHSGVEIDKEGANAAKLMGRLLYSLKECNINLASFDGGLKDNAIPRNAEVVVFADEDRIERIKEIVEQYKKIFNNEYRATDAFISITVDKCDNNISEAMDAETTNKVISVANMLPNGIVRWSKDIKGLVETSLNLGIVSTNSNKVTFSLLIRSSVDSCKESVLNQIKCICNSVGASMSVSGDYPGWEYKEDSLLRGVMVEVYEKMYGKKPIIEAIHAGLECGLFAGKIDNLDCISFGPQIDDIHTTSEKIYVDSINRTWNYLLEVLKKLK